MAHFCPNMPLGVVKIGEKENLQAHQKWACACNFCEPNFQEFCLKWWRKELFLHCGDELNGLRPSWMVLTHGNVIFDILEPPAFQKYSICWVFRAFFCSTFFYMYFATRPRPALTAVNEYWPDHAKINSSLIMIRLWLIRRISPIPPQDQIDFLLFLETAIALFTALLFFAKLGLSCWSPN